MPSAHVDTFARDNLPPVEDQPQYVFDLPELQFPEQLNCADRTAGQACHRGARRAPVHPRAGPELDLRRAARQGQPHRQRAGERHGPGARPARVAARAEQPHARGLLVRGDEGRRHRGGHHALAARQRAQGHRGHRASEHGAVRRGAGRGMAALRWRYSARPIPVRYFNSQAADGLEAAMAQAIRRVRPTSTPRPTTPASSASPRAPPACPRPPCTSTAM